MYNVKIIEKKKFEVIILNVKNKTSIIKVKSILESTKMIVYL